AHHLIENNFKAFELGGNHETLDALLNLLRAFHIACNSSIKQLNDPSPSSAFQGKAWMTWITQLTEILEEVSSPVSVRKAAGGISKRDKDSPFIRLVWELQ